MMHDSRLSQTDRDILRIVNTGPVSMKYITRMLRLPREPIANVKMLRAYGYLKPFEPGTCGYYLTREGHRELLRSPMGV